MRLIDADALKIENVDLEHGCTVVDYAMAVIKSVADAPTIEAEPVKHGRWKKRGRNLGECSGCGEVVIVRYPYCPNCGAKMDEEDEA